MKTVAEVAREFRVSPQTIYRKLNPVKQGLTMKKGGITYITDDGMTYLKDNGLTEFNNVKPLEQTENEIVLVLLEQNKVLHEALEKERAHSREIAERLAQITENQQKLLGIEQVKTVSPTLIGEREEKNRGFFGIFRRNKGG